MVYLLIYGRKFCFTATRQLVHTFFYENFERGIPNFYGSLWPSGRASDSGARGRGFNSHSGRRVLSLSKTLPKVLSKSTGNTHEAVAPSRHD